ncbi:choline transporter-like protein 2 [Dunckerocampus dactyliophorus]|uniref:choline transporter-like protein 2 n=1 Tax=Dunckerocampus dactyliophorus TaxID=161453 RepID=UPI0024059D37|nr:choline transporter-like protein 2 [Dunckerocampus dactyliophorus]
MEEVEKRPKSQCGEGKQFDPHFKGPIHYRECTDVLCCLLFIVALVGYLAVGIIAWSNGDPRKMLYPTDSDGNFCGQGSMVDKPFLFYFSILDCLNPNVLVEFQCPTPQMCVENCPTMAMWLNDAKNQAQKNYYMQYCKDSNKQVKVLPKDSCPPFLIPMVPFARRCLPELSGNTTSVKFKDLLDKQFGDAMKYLNASKNSNYVVQAQFVAMQILQDFAQSWHWIMVALVIAMVASFTFVMLLRFLAGLMVWIMIVLVVVVIGYCIIHCYQQFKGFKGENGAEVADLDLHTDPLVYLEIRQTWLAFMIILSISEVFIILLLIYLRRRILVAVALIKEASRAVGQLTSALFFPLVTFSLLSVIIAYWATTAVFLSTSNEQVYKYFCADTSQWQTCDPKNFNIPAKCSKCAFAFYGGETTYHKCLNFFQFYNLFLFLWCANFVVALGQVTLAGAFASYYWAFNKPDDIPTFPIISSLSRVLRYHMGSLAFGSMILAVVQFIRIVLEYMEQRLQGTENKVTKFLLRCLKCCFWCLEKCFRFISTNAYIMIAIYGKNFCSSAQDAFFLLMRNFIRVAVLGRVTDYLLFLGTLLIVGIVGIFSFFFFSGKMQYAEYRTPSLNYYWVPILTVVVGSYLITKGFFSVYTMCVDTLFLCFCEDLERNDGSAARPYYMSVELHEILCKTKRSTRRADAVAKPEEVVVELEEGSNLQQQPGGMIQLRQQPSLNRMNTALQPPQAHDGETGGEDQRASSEGEKEGAEWKAVA